MSEHGAVDDNRKEFLEAVRQMYADQGYTFEELERNLQEKHPDVMRKFIELTGDMPIAQKKATARVAFYLLGMVDSQLEAVNLEELLEQSTDDGDVGEDQPL